MVGYSERHHIIPKCLGGTNDKDNLVRLTAEEHFVAHKLLIMIYPKNQKLWWSAIAMTNKTKNMVRNNKSAGWLRREFAAWMAEQNRTRVVTEKTREKMRNRVPAMLGREVSEETRRKLSEAHKGKPKSPEHVANSIKARTGIKYPPRTELHRRNQSEAIKAAMKGVNREWMTAPEYKEARSIQMKRVWAERRLAKELTKVTVS